MSALSEYDKLQLEQDAAARRNGHAELNGASLCNVVDWATVKIEPVAWIIPDRIPFGELTVADGPGGIGKTTTMLDLIARASRGKPMPDGTPCAVLKTLIIAEEDRKEIIKARLLAAGADLAHVFLVHSIGEDEHFFLLPTDAGSLLATIQQYDASIVLIDALLSHLDSDIKSYNPQDVRRALGPLSKIAHEAATKPVIVAIRHWGKSARSAADRGLGSSDIRNLCRSVLSVGKHPQDEGRYVIAVSKSNLGRPCHALTYTLENTRVEGNGTTVEVASVAWGADANISADDLANDGLPSAEEVTKTAAAGDFLQDALSAGPRQSEDVYHLATKEGGFSRATLKRAAQRLKVIHTREGFPSRGTWSLPDALGSQPAQSAYITNSEPCEPTGEPSAPIGPLSDGSKLCSKCSKLGRCYEIGGLFVCQYCHPTAGASLAEMDP